jgi:murein DD-endopeptidase MepM/ murein hydrolase activator NlpD
MYVQVAVAAPDTTYKLPWQTGVSYQVEQGNFKLDARGAKCLSGCSTHRLLQMHFAWDFALPERTIVRAVRGGRVAFVQSKWATDHCGSQVPIRNQPSNYVVSANIGNEANYVVIDHGDGTSALYLHLSEVSSDIKTKLTSGEQVEQGEELGLSGKTGWTFCGSHLHFQVQATGTNWYEASRAIRFSDPDVVANTTDGVPVEGKSYGSGNSPPSQAAILAGTWVGTYSCIQGETGLRLIIRAGSGNSLQAEFVFYPIPTNPTVPSGSFAMTGSYSDANVALKQDHWINQPAGYLMVDLSGKLLTSTVPSLVGTVSGSVPGCTNFSVQKT